MKSPDFQTERVVGMEENIVGFDVKVAHPGLVQVLKGFSELGMLQFITENTHLITQYVKYMCKICKIHCMY